jgi:hypothetical protein
MTNQTSTNFGYNYAGDKFTNDANGWVKGFGIVDLSVGYTFNVGNDDETLRIESIFQLV